MTRTLIWITRENQFVRPDVLSEFGSPCVIFDRHVSPMDVSRQVRAIETEVLPHASEGDLILTVGPQIMLGTLVAEWSRRFSQTRFLVWNSKRRLYEIRWSGSARN